MEEGAKRKLTVDLEDLAGAFESGFPELHYYLDLETGEVAMVSDETRGELEAIYEDLAGGEEVDEAVVAAAIGRREVPDWQKEALLEADRVERGYGTRYVAVPRDETHAAYRDMEEFISSVADQRLQERLSDAIDGRGAFGRFKRVLSAHDEERERWFAFKDARLRERIVAWLADEGIEPAEA
ncbi:MAG TPA: UPF0158 family protein [Chloroflexota bacterium]|nr:UPF0158 family protein [Chloroflexota bacterium]